MTSSYGVKISQAGVNVETATDAQSIFSTKFSTLKLYQTGTAQLTTNAFGGGEVAVNHNLGFAPAFFVFAKKSYQDTFFSVTTYSNCYFPIGGIYADCQVYTDSDQLFINTGGLAANTTYYFKYYLFMDLAEAFSGNPSVELTNDYGIKVSKPGYDVLTCKEYELAYSSKYKSLQYYDESFKSATLSLPAFSASYYDPTPTAGTYVDITHGLGYPPFFLAYYHSTIYDDTDVNRYQEIPFRTLYGDDTQQGEYAAFADSTRVRIIFKKFANDTATYKSTPAETITAKVYIFTEDLSG